MAAAFFYLKSDPNKTHIDILQTPGRTEVVLVDKGKEYPWTLSRNWQNTAADVFVYAVGDVTKTPVDLDSQPAGTSLMLVTPGTEDVHVVAGALRIKKNSDVDTAIRFIKEHSYDKGVNKPSDVNSF